jgi:hypothetical protein
MTEHHETNDWRSTQVAVRLPRRHARPTRRRLTTLTLWLAALSVLAAQAARSTIYAADYTLFGTTTPGNPDSNDDTGSAVELGVRFYSDVAATVTGIRFYKSALNTGTHIGHLWTDAGTLLGTVTFSGETASGWQTASFDTPITIAANTVYLADYFNPNGHYAGDVNAFTTQFDNAPLHAVATASGGNGRYIYTGTPPAFPDSTYNAGNYWVDVVLNVAGETTTTSTTATTTTTTSTTTTTTLAAANYTLFGTTTPGNPDSNDDTGSSVELGVRFYSDVAATVTGIRFYKSTANTGTHIGHLWTDTGTLLGTVTFSGETASGWQTASFDTPITIAANTVYLADYFNPNGHYAGDVNAFTTSSTMPRSMLSRRPQAAMAATSTQAPPRPSRTPPTTPATTGWMSSSTSLGRPRRPPRRHRRPAPRRPRRLRQPPQRPPPPPQQPPRPCRPATARTARARARHRSSTSTTSLGGSRPWSRGILTRPCIATTRLGTSRRLNAIRPLSFPSSVLRRHADRSAPR